MMLTTEAQIAMYSLYTLRQALKLEQKGLKRSGKSANTIACKVLGLRKGTAIATTLAKLNEHISEKETTLAI